MGGSADFTVRISSDGGRVCIVPRDCDERRGVSCDSERRAGLFVGGAGNRRGPRWNRLCVGVLSDETDSDGATGGRGRKVLSPDSGELHFGEISAGEVFLFLLQSGAGEAAGSADAGVSSVRVLDTGAVYGGQ